METESKKNNIPPDVPPDDGIKNAVSQAELIAKAVGSHSDDGKLVIRFESNDLEAYADFIPPQGLGQVLSNEYIAAILEQLGINYGIDWDAIQEAAFECNTSRRPVKNIRIARGDEVLVEVGEYFELDKNFRQWPQMPDGEVPRVDYREISPFIVVNKDQILAQLVEKQAGHEGRNIRSEIVPMPTKKISGATSGKNTALRDKNIVALCDGRLVENGNELSIEEVLAISGAVGYKTGHIVFPGDVLIDGPVADGFKVYAAGSLVTKQSIDASDILAKKDLIVAGGLIGRGIARVRVGAMLRAKFIQNCHVICRGSIVVGAAIINSRIFCMEKVDLGDKGRIVGGDIYSVHGIRAAGIGSESGRATSIHLGMDFSMQQKLDKLNEKLRDLGYKLSRIREVPPDADEEKKKKYAELGIKIQAEMARLRNESSDLSSKINADMAATLEVSGTVAKGTIIEICHIAYFVDTPLRKVRFRLDSEKGRLIHETL
ncbi:hypothetical protein MASR2M78_03450 [Treponema sp.]